MILVYRDLVLLIVYCYFCSCVYMETETSRLKQPRSRLSGTNFVNKNAISKMKFKTTSDKVKPPKKKAKRNNIRWDTIYANKISFRFIDKLLSTFPRFFE